MNKLAELKKEFNLSVQEIAIKTNIIRSTLSEIINNKRDISKNHIKPLCDFFQVTSDYLLGLSEDGIYVHHEHGFCTLNKEQFKKYLHEGKISYIGYERYIDEEIYHNEIRSLRTVDNSSFSIKDQVLGYGSIRRIYDKLVFLNDRDMLVLEKMLDSMLETQEKRKN